MFPVHTSSNIKSSTYVNTQYFSFGFCIQQADQETAGRLGNIENYWETPRGLKWIIRNWEGVVMFSSDLTCKRSSDELTRCLI